MNEHTSRGGLEPPESPFGLEELFFSRTDPHGIIKACNSVFVRVSEYPKETLLESPHKIIRHRDTPRAVFHRLWSHISRGEPLGAYVKNRSQGGAPYWVYAIVSPVDGGYLSVRLKPTSDVFAATRQVYLDLSGVERRDRLDPSQSAEILDRALAELGYETYEAFMACALLVEIRARDEALGRVADPVISFFADLLDQSRVLRRRTQEIVEACTGSGRMPMNLQIQAAHYGPDGVVVGAISRNYGEIADELEAAVIRFSRSADQVGEAIITGLFLICAAKIQAEMASVFARERPEVAAEAGDELERLDSQREAYRAKALEGVQTIRRQARAFQDDCAEMSRLAAGLEVTRILGEVESARLRAGKDGLSAILGELGQLQQIIAYRLRELGHSNDRIVRGTKRLLGG